MLLAQVSRGLSPVVSILNAVNAARYFEWGYEPVLGLPLVDAKNAAVEMADSYHDGLILMEDDIIPKIDIWHRVDQLVNDQVAYARCKMRNGQDNVKYKKDGTFSHTGNVLTVIPRDVLDRLPRPVFEARKYRWANDIGDLFPCGLHPKGVGSDTDFWYKVRHLNPAPEIVELGAVTHLRHPLNEARNNQNPCKIEPW